MRTNGDIDFHAWIEVIPKDFCDSTLSTELACGIVGNFRRDDLTRFSLTLFLRWDQDLLRESAIVRNDKTNAALFLITPYNRRVFALKYLDDFALQAPPAVFTCHLNKNFVASEHKVHLTRTEVNIAALTHRHRKSIAVPMSLHATMQ